MERVIAAAAWPSQPSTATLQADARSGVAPRHDLTELAAHCDAVILDHQLLSSSRVGPLYRRAPYQVAETALMTIKGARSVLVWGEPVAFTTSLAAHLPGRIGDVHVMSHLIDTPKRRRLARWTGLVRQATTFMSQSPQQLDVAATLGVDRRRLHHVTFGLDTDFWSTTARAIRPPGHKPLVIAVGSEARDYPTLGRALDGLDVDVDLVVGSMVNTATLPVSLRPPSGQPRPRRTHVELRALYAQADIAVIPLLDVGYDAGVNAICEAMAMGCAVVTTRSAGLVDVVMHDDTALVVDVGDAVGMRHALQQLVDDPAAAFRMGQRAQHAVRMKHGLDHMLDQLAAITGWPGPR
jgi:glycosyltransferase involved in cell wall biosynthesis